jgi:hypothetical protein
MHGSLAVEVEQLIEMHMLGRHAQSLIVLSLRKMHERGEKSDA